MQDLIENHIRAQQLCAEQAEDDALWGIPATAAEEYLQIALRKLHATVEGDDDMVRGLQRPMAKRIRDGDF